MQQRELLTKLFETKIEYFNIRSQIYMESRDQNSPDQILTCKNEGLISKMNDSGQKTINFLSERQEVEGETNEAEVFEFLEAGHKDFSTDECSSMDIFKEHEIHNAQTNLQPNIASKLEGNTKWHKEDNFQSSDEESMEEESSEEPQY